MLTAIMPDEIHIHFLLTFCLFFFSAAPTIWHFFFLLFLFFFIVITPYLISISYHCFNLLSCTSKMFSDLSNVIIHATITAIIIIAPYPRSEAVLLLRFCFCSRAASVTMQTPSAQVLFPENPQEPCTPMASYVSCHRPALRFC